MKKAINIKNLSSIFFFLIVISLGSYVYVRGQDTNWDLLNYHFYQGYALINGRFIDDIAAANLQTFLNPIINLFVYLFLTYFPFPINAWSILLIQLFSIPALALLANSILLDSGYKKTSITSYSAIALCLLSPLWLSELGTSFSSSWTAPLILWAIYFLYSSDSSESYSKKKIFFSGALLSLATGLKLTNAVFAVSGLLMVCIIYFDRNTFGRFKPQIFFLTGCACGFLLTVWWNFSLWIFWGSPIFPLYNSIFKSEYYDLVNFRDMRWHFESFQTFLLFIINSIGGTSKSSEVLFADVRYFFVLLLSITLVLCKSNFKKNKNIISLLAFYFLSYFLWALIFAYQRYLIPIELITGLIIWILIIRTTDNILLQRLTIIIILIISTAVIKIPDWGHSKTHLWNKNPFSMQIESNIINNPGRYIVIGVPMSYVLPYFNGESIFYGLGFSKQVDNLISRKLTEPSVLPTRVLAKATDAHLIISTIENLGFKLVNNSMDCNFFKTNIDRYIVCEIVDKHREASQILNFNFSKDGLDKKGILFSTGLSTLESWGAWSDSEVIKFQLTGCLPLGDLKLEFIAHAYGPNTTLPFKVMIGKNTNEIFFSDVSSTQSISFINYEDCISTVEVFVPKPTSPKSLGKSEDSRNLGLGLVGLRIEKN